MAEDLGDALAGDVLAATLDLLVSWTSLGVQRGIAAGVGVDIGESDIRTLYTLGRNGGTGRPAQIAEILSLSRPTTSKSLARLQSAGLVERRAVAGDARSTDIVLTASGERAYRRLADAGVEMVRAALGGVDAGAAEIVIEFMRALVSGAGAGSRRTDSPESGMENRK